MASIPGVRFDITGASGTQGLLTPKSGWRAYILPRGAHASQDSAGTLITFDSADAASRFTANDWIQAGLDTGNIRQVSAVAGNSLSVSGAALTISENDRIFLIGTTQPTVTGGSATYTTPNTLIRTRDDNAGSIISNSMVTSNSNGLIQFWTEQTTGPGVGGAFLDCIIQDGNRANQGSIIDIEVGTGTARENWTVTAYTTGGVVASAGSASPVTVDSGHSFLVNDKLMVGTDGTTMRTVSAVTPTTISYSGAALTVAVADLLTNLGADTGSSTPNYDASRMSIYSDMDHGTAISNSRVTVNSDGKAPYFSKGDGAHWELWRNASGSPQEVVPGRGVAGQYHVVDFGATGDGSTDDYNSVNVAVLGVSSTGGVLVGNAADTYLIGTDVTIEASNVAVDFRGALLMGAHEWLFDGDSGTDGDRSTVRSNCFFRNARFGDGTGSNMPTGVRFFWCDDCGMENLQRDCPSGTFCKLSYAKRCFARNIYIRQGEDEAGNSGAIGSLLLHCEDCLLDNLHIDGASTPFLYGVQVKGGYNNTVINCRIRDVVDGSNVTTTHGFRDRGDAPWSSSGTTGTYPYASGAWGASDAQRASHDTRFINCVVENSEFNVGCIATESIGTHFLGGVVRGNTGGGIVVERISGGDERDFVLQDCVVDTMRGAAGIGVGIQGVSGAILPNTLVANCQVHAANLEGYVLNYSSDVRLIGCLCRNTGQNTPDGFDGFEVKNENVRVSILGCDAYDDQDPPTQRRGVHIRSGNTATKVFDSHFSGNSTAQVTDSGTISEIRRNTGFITENSGTATIASGSSSVIVTHGLGVTPTLDDISVVLGQVASNDPGNIWVDTLGSTQFTINCRTDPGASSLAVAWLARAIRAI